MAAYLVLTAFTPAHADDPLTLIPITANAAFDAVTKQVDPVSHANADVYLIDVRDPYEVYMNGGPAAVKTITLLNGKTIEPEHGKVRLMFDGRFIFYSATRHNRFEPVNNIKSMDAVPLATNIPVWRLNLVSDAEVGLKATFDKTTESRFLEAMKQNYQPGASLILFCRTGGRSSVAGELLSAFALQNGWTLYEIDDPAGKENYGGFNGAAYDGALVGYDGFPGRVTGKRVPSASWLDAGLPVMRKSTAIVLP